MIQITELVKSFGEQKLFSEVDLHIGAKEKVGIIGRNGSGKSTFLKIILEQESFDFGKIRLRPGIKIRALEQHLQFSETTLLEQICINLEPSEKNESWRAKAILMGLGFSEHDFEKNPQRFSSGMQIRIRLAQALVGESDLLLLDEPTNYLDIISLRWLERFLQSWKKAFLLVTHDQHFMKKVVTHTVALHRGKMRKINGGPKKVMQHILKDEEVMEKTRQNAEKKKVKTEHFIRNFRAGARSAGLVQSRIKALEKQEIGSKLEYLPKITFQFHGVPFRGNALLRLANIDFAYENNMTIIKKFNLDIGGNERIAIIGKNGKGKSTLLRLMGEKLRPTSGHLKRYHTLQTGFFGEENKKELDEKRSILSELLSVGNTKEEGARKLAGSLLFSGNAVKKNIGQLSGGEKSRVGLGKVMLSPAHLLFLDEPSNHLDMESVEELTRAMKAFSGSIVFVSHDEELLLEVATKLIVFEEDKIVIKEMGYRQFLCEGGWGDETALKIEKEKSSDKKHNTYAERKELQKRLRFVQNHQEKRAAESAIIREELEEKGRKLERACIEKDIGAIEKIGKTIRKLELDLEKKMAEEEKLFEEEIELEEKMKMENCVEKTTVPKEKNM